jgi:hypothetical protein
MIHQFGASTPTFWPSSAECVLTVSIRLRGAHKLGHPFERSRRSSQRTFDSLPPYPMVLNEIISRRGRMTGPTSPVHLTRNECLFLRAHFLPRHTHPHTMDLTVRRRTDLVLVNRLIDGLQRHWRNIHPSSSVADEPPLVDDRPFTLQ